MTLTVWQQNATRRGFRSPGSDPRTSARRAKAQPTIVVLVEPWTRANWFELRAKIMYQLSPHMQTDDFDIEFLPGGLSHLTNGGESFVDRLTPSSFPRMGYSIGIQGDKNAGTLGGFVTLTHNGIAHRSLPRRLRLVILKDIEGLFFSRINKRDTLRNKSQTYSIPFSRYVFWMLFLDALLRYIRRQRLFYI